MKKSMTVILGCLAICVIVGTAVAQFRAPEAVSVPSADGFTNIMVQRMDLDTPETKVMPQPSLLTGQILPIGFTLDAFDDGCREKPRCQFVIIGGGIAVQNSWECGRRKWHMSECYETDCNGETYRSAILYQIEPAGGSDLTEVNTFWNNDL